MSKRFMTIYKENGMTDAVKIIVDTETGVHYLLATSGYAGGLSVLLDEKGNPVIDKTARKEVHK